MPIDRRRAHSSDEDDQDQYNDRKRRRKEINEIEERLENLILRVGEKGASSLESNLEGLAGVLESDLETYKNRILDILARCVLEMPEKLTIYSTLAGLLNAKNYNFGSEFVELLLTTLRDKLKEQDYDASMFLVIFLCDLVNSHVVSAHSCLSFLENFIEAAFEMSVPQVRTDWFVYTVLHALPWVGKELSEKKSTDLTRLLASIETYMDRRQKLHAPMLRVWSSQRPHAQEEYLDCLWAQINKLRAEGWLQRHISRHYIAFDAVLCEALQHNLPSFVPPAHRPNNTYPLPKVIFRMFDYTDCPEDGPVLPGAHSIERFLIEQDLNWIIRQHHAERKNCAAALLNYQKKSKIPLNYVVLEVVFGQLFNLPTPPYLELFYGSLLIELCKLQPNSMPQVLAQAAELLYQRIDTMQPACFDRFVDWFSYHLSNFQFRWSWEDWTDCLELEWAAPKQLFVREVFHKAMRLSYHQRLTDIAPASFSDLVPPKPQPNFKYSQDGAQDLSGTSIAHHLAQAIRSKCSSDDALFVLKDCPNTDELNVQGFNPLAIDVFVLTLLHLGSKSFSHSFAALTKYNAALKSLAENNEEAQLCILQAVYELWATHPQMMCVLVDKLLKMQVVDCAVVVRWIFGQQLKDEFLRMWIWEIMQGVLTKLSKHVDRLRSDLETAQMKLKDDEEKPKQELDEDDRIDDQDDRSVAEMEEKLQNVESVQKNLLATVFQNFTILLTEHLLNSETEGKDFNSHWYRWVTGRLRQMFLIQHTEAGKQMDYLETHLFTNDIDPHILEIYHQFCALVR